MRNLLVICFLLISFLGFGQSVSAPDSKSFIPSTTAQDASGFVLNGFSTFFNSFWFSTILAVSQTIVSAMTGFAFARYEFSGKKILFGI